jgi:hypothetical protein
MEVNKVDRILFIAPFFYNYEIDIFNELKEHSNNVDTVFYSFGQHKLPWKKKKKKKIISQQKLEILELMQTNKYDLLFVLKGEILSKSDINLFKTLNPLSKTLVYQWDSIKNLPFDFDFIKAFDFKFTFDHNDAKNHEDLKLRPLFFTKEFKQSEELQIEYEFATVGGFKLSRVNFINMLKNQFPSLKFKIRLRTFLTFNIFHNIIKTGLKKYFDYALFKDLNRTEISILLNKAKVIIDIPNKGQTGLSMRTIETLGLQKKIITTCSHIKKYDFFNSNNHLIIDDCSKNQIFEFLEKPYQKITDEVISKYSLKGFINSLINNRVEKYLK